MHVARVVNRQGGREYVSWLLRQSYREGASVKHRTLANLSPLPLAAVEAIRAVLRGDAVGTLRPNWDKLRSLPHGHVQAVLEATGRLQVERLLDPSPSKERDLVLGMIVARVLHPASKLATISLWQQSTLATVLQVQDANADDLYGALDWLLARKPRIEAGLARRHLHVGGQVLYDLSSSYFEGRHCQLAKIGYSRDRKRGTLQVEYGLLCAPGGEPIAIDVFEGNVGDPTTVPAQVRKLKEQFQLQEFVLVGDRGMLTQTRLDELKAQGIDWITTLREPAIQALVEAGDLQLSIFDQRNLAEITSPKYPGERLVVCKNPLLAEERARKRQSLLAATETLLEDVKARVQAGRLKTAAAIGLQVGKVVDRHKMAKHFELEMAEGKFEYRRREREIAAEAALDGIYVIRTSVGTEQLSTSDSVRAYKRLVKTERAFRTMKSVDMQIRPIRHWSDDRVRAHHLLAMLAYYVRFHLEKAWAPLLFNDEEPPVAEDPVAPRRRSEGALRKAHTQRLADGSPVHSFKTLLEALKTITRDWVRPHGMGAEAEFTLDTVPNSLQQRALALVRSLAL